MIPVPTIRRLPGGLPYIAGDFGQVESEQQGAVMQQVRAFALLRVAGKLASGARQIAGPGLGDPRSEARERLGDLPKNVAIGGADILQSGMLLIGKDKTVEQAARSEQHGAAAAGTP